MKIIRSIVEFNRIVDGSVGFVPTMGSFHEGHLSLMRSAKAECERVVVSLFVNPTQFGQEEDYSTYPRDEERDFALAEKEGVDFMFAPSVAEMFPRLTTTITVAGVSEGWEGASRPGHFEGVATVVAKLFHIVGPDVAYFGLKDLQQCAVIRRMVEDLNIPVALRTCEVVRESDGLAMSSRNVRLSTSERLTATELFRTLAWVAKSLGDLEAERPYAAIDRETYRLARERLESAGIEVDYVAAVEPDTMMEADSISKECRVIGAARLGRVRLIDNVPVTIEQAEV